MEHEDISIMWSIFGIVFIYCVGWAVWQVFKLIILFLTGVVA